MLNLVQEGVYDTLRNITQKTILRCNQQKELTSLEVSQSFEALSVCIEQLLKDSVEAQTKQRETNLGLVKLKKIQIQNDQAIKMVIDKRFSQARQQIILIQKQLCKIRANKADIFNILHIVDQAQKQKEKQDRLGENFLIGKAALRRNYNGNIECWNVLSLQTQDSFKYNISQYLLKLIKFSKLNFNCI